jgi:hypothetical protein
MKRLSKEIVLSIGMKLLLLWLLWYICFKPYKHPRFNDAQVIGHMLTMQDPIGEDIK